MSTTKVTINIDRAIPVRLDALVKQRIFPGRSRAVQEAVKQKLARLDRSRLARESAKLDSKFEQMSAEDGLSAELAEWREYYFEKMRPD